MTNVSDVNAMDVFGVIEKPSKEKTLEKYCVCISVGKNSDKYFYINSQPNVYRKSKKKFWFQNLKIGWKTIQKTN